MVFLRFPLVIISLYGRGIPESFQSSNHILKGGSPALCCELEQRQKICLNAVIGQFKSL
jgi:hypothetical protein